MGTGPYPGICEGGLVLFGYPFPRTENGEGGFLSNHSVSVHRAQVKSSILTTQVSLFIPSSERKAPRTLQFLCPAGGRHGANMPSPCSSDGLFHPQ